MYKILHCRRSCLALIGMVCLMALDLINKEPCAVHIVTIVMSIAAANASEKVLTKARSPDTSQNPQSSLKQ